MSATALEVAYAERHRDRYNLILDRSVETAERAWDRLPGYTDADAVEVWARTLEPIESAAIKATVEATDTYLGVVTELGPLAEELPTAASLRGLDEGADLARRPFATVYRSLADGRDIAQAIGAGRARVAEMTSSTVALAQRDTVDRWVTAGRIDGYRRTLTGRSCPLCALASTQRYHRGSLMPIHARCDCGIAPILGASDPALVANRRLLRELKAAGVEKTGSPIRSVEVRDHGELGPVLTKPGEKFTGPRQVGATPSTPPKPPKRQVGPTNAEKVRNAETMYGTGSPQHVEAKRRFEDPVRPTPAKTAVGRAPVLSEKQLAELKPRWDLQKRQRVIAELRKTPEGKLLESTLSGFQSGASRGIPLLRTDIEKRLAGLPLDPGRAARVDNLLGAMNQGVPAPKTIFRGMRVDGSPADIAARYRGQSELDLGLSSFSSDKKLAQSFATSAGAGARGARAKAQTAVRIEVDNADGALKALPIENLAKSKLYANEKEWVSGGRFAVESVTEAKDGTVVIRVRQTASLGAV